MSAAQQAGPQPEIAITFFSDEYAKRKREERLTPEQLAQRISRVSQPTKERLPWLKCARFGDQRTDKDSLRHDANVLGISGIEGDYDAKSSHGRLISFEEAITRVRNAGIAAIVYTSPSFSEGLQKYRVLAPLSAEHPPKERDRYMARLNGLFDGGFASESWALSQSYFYGAVNHNPSHRVEVIEGICIDQADHLDATAIGRPEKSKSAAAHGPHHPAAKPENITDKRIRGLVESLLSHVRNAKDGEKYSTLRDISFTVGGYLYLIGWTVDEAVSALVDALPNSVKDWEHARKTARNGVEDGAKKPLDLEERPNPKAKIAPEAEPQPDPEPVPGWRRRLLLNEKGQPRSILANALIALREAPVWQGVFAWNEFSSRVSVMRHLPGPRHNSLEVPRELSEADISRVTDWLQHQNIRVSSGITLEAIRTVADHHRFHPVRSYLLGLHWDAVPRIDRWLINHLGAEDNSLNQALGAKWLIGCVARVMRPGCKLDTALILESRQGLMKSTALATLGNPWFTDHMPDLGSKDAMEQLQGVWVIELAELSSLSRVESARIKAFLSTRVDRFRPSYGRTAADHPRQCAFGGSINPAGSGYLRDETGNRRFWCVKCAVDWPDDRRVDIPELAAQRDQLWAEAVHRYQQHEPWWLDTATEAQAEAEAEERFENDSRESIIRNYLRGRAYTRMTELFGEPCLNIPTDRQTRTTQIEIGRIMTAMKWTRRRRRDRHQELEWVYIAPDKHLDDIRD